MRFLSFAALLGASLASPLSQSGSACAAATSQVTSCVNQRALTAYCSTFLAIPTSSATLTKTSTSKVYTTVTQTRRVVTSIVGTVTASPTIVTVTPTSTVTITSIAATVTTTALAFGFTCLTNIQSTTTAQVGKRAPAVPDCLSVYTASADVSSVCGCLDIPTTTVVTQTTVATPTTITRTQNIVYTTSITKTVGTGGTSTVVAGTPVFTTVSVVSTAYAATTISPESRFVIQAINQAGGPGDHQFLTFGNGAEFFQAQNASSAGVYRWENGTCNLIDTVYESSNTELYVVLQDPSCTGCQEGTLVTDNYSSGHSNPSVYCNIDVSTSQLACASTSGESVSSVCDDSTANGTWYIEDGVRTRGTESPYVCLETSMFAQFV